jgi:hypothetical protein
MKPIVSILLILTVCTCACADSKPSTLIRQGDENVWVECPEWDWSLVPPECRRPAFNCVPTCGKWPGDKTDIGAYEYVPGITSQKPWGIWEGVPFAVAPGTKPLGDPKPPINLRGAKPPPPTDLVITGVKRE